MLTLIKALTLSLSFLGNVVFAQQAKPNPQAAFVSHTGNISLDAAKAIPTQHASSMVVSGYPGSKLHFGAFTAQKEWDAFAKHAKLNPGKIDWKKQAIAFVVFDGQTNALHSIKLTKKKTTGVISFEWDAIEPYYADSTPALLLVIDRTNLKKLSFKHAKTVGSVSL